MRWTIALTLAVVAAACAEPQGDADIDESAEESPRGGRGAEWLLAGSERERFERIARQLRGFDVAMVEVGYRYTELYWAGRDENWGFAQYQLEKIRTAIANGLERRPARATSARMIDAPLASVERAIEARDPAAFDRDFDQLTATCNACHRAERVEFVTVAVPTTRLSPVRFGEAASDP